VRRSGLAEHVGWTAMTEPLTRADHYRKEAAKYHELAKFARPAYLGDFYRRIASRYPRCGGRCIEMSETTR
jgi:hypothetical protein